MNLAQHYYGDCVSTVAHQCGRLFTERAVFFLLDMEPPKVYTQSLHQRIDSLGSKVSPNVKRDLHALREIGNRVDHAALEDVKPEEKAEIVESVFRIALVALDIADRQCREQSRPHPSSNPHPQRTGTQQAPPVQSTSPTRCNAFAGLASTQQQRIPHNASELHQPPPSHRHTPRPNAFAAQPGSTTSGGTSEIANTTKKKKKGTGEKIQQVPECQIS
jgi:hypothetical protein